MHTVEYYKQFKNEEPFFNWNNLLDIVRIKEKKIKEQACSIYCLCKMGEILFVCNVLHGY